MELALLGIGIVGCGYVADFYLATVKNHPSLHVVGAFDVETTRLTAFSDRYGVVRYPSFDALLRSASVDLVVNLTNPRSHMAVTAAALAAGKHVYTEKPLALTLGDATTLVEMAEESGLVLASAPCTHLGESAQTVWKLLRDGAIGQPLLAYAEMDDGAIHLMPYREWLSDSGIPWPFRDEFETGCVLEHASYYLTWLTTFFGPAREIVSFANVVAPVEEMAGQETGKGTDFSVGCISFSSGVHARLTCSTVAPRDHSLKVVGTDGVLHTDECWDYGSRVTLRRRATAASRSSGPLDYLEPAEEVPLVRAADYEWRYVNTHDMDIARGISEAARAVESGTPCRLSARHALHVLELALVLDDRDGYGRTKVESTFEAVDPMGWAI